MSGDRVASRLVPPALERKALSLVLVATGLLALLTTYIARGVGPGRLDTLVDEHLIARTRWTRHLAHAVANLGSPAGVIPLSVAAAALLLFGRRPRAAVLIVVAPAVASAVTEWVLKPLVGEKLMAGVRAGPALPSGHATGIFSVALVIVLVALTQRQPRSPGPLQWTAAVLALGVGAAVATALIAGRLHYFTATIGGGLVALVVVLAGALALDAVIDRMRWFATAGSQRLDRPRAQTWQV